MAEKSHQDPSEIISAIYTGDLEKVKSLWEAGSLLYKKCGGPALCSAAFHNNIVLAEYLLSAGVNINYREGYEGSLYCAQQYKIILKWYSFWWNVEQIFL